MASPIRFCGYNKVLNPAPGTEDTVQPLYVHGNGIENISCWKLTPAELAEINRTGEMWFSIASGETSHPILLSGIPMMAAYDLDSGEQTTYYSNGQHMVDDARRFATLHHGEQWYDEPRGLRHTYHLGKVVEVLQDFGADWRYLVAAWLHDFVEDCWQDKPVEERRAAIVHRFGGGVDMLVWAVTGEMFVDGVKQNRKTRNKQQYVKIAALPESAIVKGGDRIANIEACIEFEAPQGPMYLDEMIDFDDNVGIYMPLAMRVRLWKSALRLEELAGPSRKLPEGALQARAAEVFALASPPVSEPVSKE